MKKLFIILNLIYSHLAISGSYEFFEIDVQEILISIREKDDSKLNISELSGELEDYMLALDDAIPLIKNIYAKAVELKHNLQSDNNMPNLVQLISLCSKNVADRMAKLKNKSIKKNNLVTYTSILNCNAIINFTAFELKHFIYNNDDFMNNNNFFDEIRRFYLRTYDLSRIMSETSMFFLAYLQLDTNTYPESLQ